MSESEIHPRVAAALRAQLVRWRQMLDGGARRVGWKIGLGVEPVQNLMGDAPVFGHLTSATVLQSGESFSAAGTRKLRAETELAITVGADVEGNADLDEARDAIAGYAVALELVDVGGPPFDLEGILADNVYHRAFAVGPTLPWLRTHGTAAHSDINDRSRASAPLADDYAPTVRSIARLLAVAGERLTAGDQILAGGLTHVPMAAGDHVVASIDELGTLEATITG